MYNNLVLQSVIFNVSLNVELCESKYLIFLNVLLLLKHKPDVYEMPQRVKVEKHILLSPVVF